jgi:effector-binding domain-containing protein
MTVQRIHAGAHPIISVTGRVTMDPGEIEIKSSKAFSRLQGFMAQNHIIAVGPPLAIYQDWNGRTLRMDVGFPVNAMDLTKATGEVLADKTPEGSAATVSHRGPYSFLRSAHSKIQADIAEAGIKPTGLSWEVYRKGPGTAAEAEYETDIYIQVRETGQ